MIMTVRRRLFLFAGFLSIIILLIAVIAVVLAGRPNYVQYSSVPFTAGERYLTDKFEPAFSFETVGEGWGLDGPEAPYVVALRGRGLNIDFQNIEDFMVFGPSGRIRYRAQRTWSAGTRSTPTWTPKNRSR
jgi:hypothetical protein